MFPWLWASALATLVGADTVSIGVTNGTGDTNLSVRIDFGNDNSKCGPNPVCDALNASCLAENPPKLQLELCQEIGGVMSVEYVTGATEQVSNHFYNTKCEGTPMQSEVVTQGACMARGDNDEEARQYFPLVGVCNNGSTEDFVKHYVSEPQGYSSPIEYPTDVCLSNGEGESKVLTIHEEKVFRVVFEDSSCTGEPKSVEELSSATISEVSCLDFASVNIDWNLDGVINNDGRNGTELVTTTTTTTTTTTSTTTTTTTAATTTTTAATATASTTTTTTPTTATTTTSTTTSTANSDTSTGTVDPNSTTNNTDDPGAISSTGNEPVAMFTIFTFVFAFM